jgi:hypothetical protein
MTIMIITSYISGSVLIYPVFRKVEQFFKHAFFHMDKNKTNGSTILEIGHSIGGLRHNYVCE